MRRFVSVVAVLLLLVAMATAASVDRHEKSLGDEVKREKRATTACEDKYAELNGHTLCKTDNPDAVQVELDDTMKQHILHLHNYYRCIVEPTATDMLMLVWDEKLERTAKKWAMQCPGNHDTNRKEPDWNLLSIGQNIGFGHKTWEIMMDRFYTENTRKNYTYGENFTSDGYGHYYQMVTAQTVRVGCGQAYCPNSKYKRFRVCNYAQCMDTSKPPYKNGTSCSDCPDTCSANYSLCDCGGKLCLNGGTLNPNTCECECTEFYVGENCSENNCAKPDDKGCKRYIYSNCGVKGFVLDKGMCPHLCKLCPACYGKTCENGGTLNEDTCECQCTGNYNGEFCEHACYGKTCENGGTLNEDTCECQCTGDYKGEFCERYCTNCMNGGVLDPSTCLCNCTSPYYGDLCEKECTMDCKNEGAAVTNNGACWCSCKEGYHGSTCELECKDNAACSWFHGQHYCSKDRSEYMCNEQSMAEYCPECCYQETGCPPHNYS